MNRPRTARPRVDPGERVGALVGAKPAMRAVFHKLRILAPTTLSVLIEGETGTGKELVARALHDHSTGPASPSSSWIARPRYAMKARASDVYWESKAQHDRAFFTALFEATGGNLSQMGRRAQLSRETVRAYLKAFGIGGYRK